MSPTKIERLTEKQIARIPEWVNRWVGIGLSTERADWEVAENAAKLCYSLAQLKKPRVILRMGSPHSATLGGILAVTMLGNKQVQSQVQSQVESQVWSQVRSQVESQVGDAAYQYRGAQLWASWYSYITFFRDVCGWKNNTLDLFAPDEALALSCGWTWWHDDVCAISDRMSFIQRDERGRLHNTSGPALAYPDGWSIYSVHGVRVPESIITDPHSITVRAIDSESNAEVRRVMIDQMGREKYVHESGAKEVSRDGFGVLYQRETKDGDRVMLVLVDNPTPEPDGTFKKYFLPVDPSAYGGIRTAQAAVASTWRRRDGSLVFDRPEAYQPDYAS